MIEGLLPGSDRIYKYMVSVGVILILFVIIYPLKKEQELEVASLELDCRVDVSKLSFDKLMYIDSFNTELKAQITSLQLRKLKEIDSINRILNSNKKWIDSFSTVLIVENTKLQYDNKKSILIKQQIRRYFALRISLFIFGILLLSSGFLFWISSAYMEDKIANSNQKSLFVIFIDWILSYRIISFMILLFYLSLLIIIPVTFF